MISAGLMLLLGIAARMGVYVGAAERMMDWHMYFSLTPGGIVGGMVEAAIIALIVCWLFAYCYNHCVDMVRRR